MKYFWEIISYFIGLGNDNRREHLEVRWLVSYVDTSISNIDNVEKISIVFYDDFQMFS